MQSCSCQRYMPQFATAVVFAVPKCTSDATNITCTSSQHNYVATVSKSETVALASSENNSPGHITSGGLGEDTL